MWHWNMIALGNIHVTDNTTSYGLGVIYLFLIWLNWGNEAYYSSLQEGGYNFKIDNQTCNH